MEENEEIGPAGMHPAITLLIIVAVIFLGFVVVGPLIGVLFALPFFDGGAMEIADALQHPQAYPNSKVMFYIVQACSTGIGLIIGPALLMLSFHKSPLRFFRGKKLELTPVVITCFTIIVFIVVNSVFIEWNSNIHFPEFLKGFEEWARRSEDRASELTTFLTKFDNTQQFLLALFVIAVLPGIGEELVFRGLIQNEFARATKNIHVAIWVSAFLFSAIHMQFFGFVPRLLLGALFGYLYHWSGKLSIAMIAHFFHNGLSVAGLYFYQRGAFDYDIENAEAAPWPFVLVCSLITVALLYAFWKYYNDRRMLSNQPL